MKSGETIILLQASDFHVRAHEGDPLCRPHDIRQLFAFDAEQMAKEIGVPTALIFSGDIAFGGGAEEYDVARQMFASLLARLGLNEQRILVVPGNHDVSRGKAAKLEARMLRDSLRAGTDKDAEAVFIAQRAKLLEPIAAFHEFAMPYDCLIKGDNGYWEINNLTGSSASEYLAADFPLSIRGISTVHASDRNDDQMDNLLKPEDDGSHMYVARGQLSCDPLTDASPFRVIVGHHPPAWWRFSDNRKNLIQARYHLHLFGHEHMFSPQSVGNAVCVGAGAINPDDLENDQARYNWIKIRREGDGYMVRIWSRVYDHKYEKFCEDGEWLGGKGFLISQKLDGEVSEVAPECQPTETIATVDSFQESGGGINPASTRAFVDQEAKQPSSHAVRFALLSQNHARYALVFKELGFEPNETQRKILGGLEYYEEVLEELLQPENIGKLIAAMIKEGINVN